MNPNLAKNQTEIHSAPNILRMPAEWELHEATWLGWPHNASDWPGKLSTIHWVYSEIVRKLIAEEQIFILVNSKHHEARAKRFLFRAGVNPNHIRFFQSFLIVL